MDMVSRDQKNWQIAAHIVMIILAALAILPFILLVVASFTQEDVALKYGYSYFPKAFSLEAYKYIGQNASTFVRAYGMTIIVTLFGTVGAIVLTALTGYVLSKRNLPGVKVMNLYVIFTMLFNGGLVPTYILMTQMLHLKNTYFSMIAPLLVNVWYLMMLKTFMNDIPNEILESAKIDGAGHFMIYARIVLPLSKPALATIGLLTLLDYWNSWYPAMLYIDDKDLYPLQYLLQVMLRNIMEILKDMQNNLALGDVQALPSESARMAMCILAVGPMLFIFPFFQKYFTRGLTVGAVKG